MAIKAYRTEDPQLALGILFALAGFDFAERDTKAIDLFHRLFPSVTNGQYVILRGDDDQAIGAAAWYECAPAYAAIVLNETRPITAGEARSGVVGASADGSEVQGHIIWHTMLAPFGATEVIEGLLKQEIVKITAISTKTPLFNMYRRVNKNYNLLDLKQTS